jgi:hypothetical protein
MQQREIKKPFKVQVINADGRIEYRIIDLSEPWAGWVPEYAVIANREQPREYFDPVELALLGESLRSGQSNPSTAIPLFGYGDGRVTWMIGDGERRLRSLRMEGLVKLWISYSPDITKENLHEHAFKSNCCRKGHTHAEAARAIDRELKTGKKYFEIAAMVGNDEGWAKMTHAYLKLEPTLLTLLDPPTKKEDRMPLAVANAIVSRTHAEQLKLWNQAKGMGRKGSMVLKVQAQRSNVSVRGYRRKPSDEIQLVKRRLRRMTDDLSFLNDEWRERIEATFPGVNVSLMTDEIDRIVTECGNLKSFLIEVSKREKPVPVAAPNVIPMSDAPQATEPHALPEAAEAATTAA